MRDIRTGTDYSPIKERGDREGIVVVDDVAGDGLVLGRWVIHVSAHQEIFLLHLRAVQWTEPPIWCATPINSPHGERDQRDVKCRRPSREIPIRVAYVCKIKKRERKRKSEK